MSRSQIIPAAEVQGGNAAAVSGTDASVSGTGASVSGIDASVIVR